MIDKQRANVIQSHLLKRQWAQLVAQLIHICRAKLQKVNMLV